jgi:SAM-dependent methyltransferase
MPEFNLLATVPKQVRNYKARKQNKEVCRAIASQFGLEYFDGSREEGYGGYVYDGRWKAVAKNAIERYGIKQGHRVLDIGCAKGFFLFDLREALPGVEVVGLDISAYALQHVPPSLKGVVQQGTAEKLPYGDESFDAVFAINSLHNLNPPECLVALKEAVRVCKSPDNIFVQVDAYTNEVEKELFLDWMLTAQSHGTPAWWLDLFDQAGYSGDYYWTRCAVGLNDIADEKHRSNLSENLS